MATVAFSAGYYTRAIRVPVRPIFSGLDRRAEVSARRSAIAKLRIRGRGAGMIGGWGASVMLYLPLRAVCAFNVDAVVY